MSVLICPNCKTELSKNDHCYTCTNGHSFDLAKQGYVNLMLSQKSSKKRHGDDKLMLNSRTEFLSAGYYEPLKSAVCKTVFDTIESGGTVLDCGCGEGYYTEGVYHYLKEHQKESDVIATDISKDALITTARRAQNLTLMVSSVAQLPVKTGSIDVITSIFAPYCDTEFYRVLKKNGVLIRVIPLENHLLELKQAIYENPYKNVPDMPPIFGFELMNRQDVKYEFTIENNQINNLFMMTPYYYKTSKEDQEKVANLKTLTVTAEFALLTYGKL